MLPIKAVAFDLGGVLIRIHHNWEGAVQAAAVDCTASGPLGGFGEFETYQAGAIDSEAFLDALKSYLRLEDRDAALAVHMAVLREPYENTAELVQDLLARDVRCGCLSNTNALHWATFFDGARFPFGPGLDFRVGSHLVRANKPDQAIYRAFEQASECTGAEIAYFDDNAPNVEAGLRLGWRAWLIDPAGDPVRQIRDHLGL